MPAKRTLVAVSISAVALMITFAGAGQATPPAGQSKTRTIDVVIRFSDAHVRLDLGGAGSSTGDTETFSGPMFDTEGRRIGFAQGHCVITLPNRPLAQCTASFFFPRGQIATQGPNYFTRPFNQAIVGGTGEFRSARGEVRAAPLPGNGLDLTFKVLR